MFATLLVQILTTFGLYAPPRHGNQKNTCCFPMHASTLKALFVLVLVLESRVLRFKNIRFPFAE